MYNANFNIIEMLQGIVEVATPRILTPRAKGTGHRGPHSHIVQAKHNMILRENRMNGSEFIKVYCSMYETVSLLQN